MARTITLSRIYFCTVLVYLSSLPCYAQQCNNGDNVGENNVDDVNTNIDVDIGASFLMKSGDSKFTITCCGQIQSWEIYAGGTGEIRFHVWRHNGTLWKLVGENTYTVTATGKSTFTVPSSDQISVQGKDIVGWYAPGFEIIMYKSTGTSRNYLKTTSVGALPVDSWYNWDSETLQSSRKYALKVDLLTGGAPSMDNLDNSISVPNDRAIGGAIFVLNISDPNTNEVLTVSMTTSSTEFSLNTTAYSIVTLSSLSIGTKSLSFSVTDQCGNTDSGTLTITTYLANYFEVTEGDPAGAQLGPASHPDVDVGATGTYTITTYSSGSSGALSINNTGVITTDIVLDRETQASYIFNVEIVRSSQTSTTTVTVIVLDTNDSDPYFINSTLSGNTTEGDTVGTQITQVSAVDLDIGFNYSVTYSFVSSSGNPENTYLNMDSSTGLITVKSVIDRETVSSFSFEIEAVEQGTGGRTSTATVSITVNDVNDNTPVLVSTFYNGAIPHTDTCGGTVTTISATDADKGKNARMYYYLVQSDDSYYFQMNDTTGELQTAGYLSKQKYVVSAQARDNGNTELHTTDSVLIRVDTFQSTDVVISFYLDIGKSTYLGVEDTFISKLENEVFGVSYTNPKVKRWCIEEVSQNSIIVHIYVLETNMTEDSSNINVAKDFLNSTIAHLYLATDESGTLSAKLTGNSWSSFNIQKVIKYSVPTTSTSSTSSTPWIETTVGIAVLSASGLLALLLIITIMIIACKCCRKNKKAKNHRKKKNKKTQPIQDSVETPVPKQDITTLPYHDIPPPYDRGYRQHKVPPMFPLPAPLSEPYVKPSYKKSKRLSDPTVTTIGISPPPHTSPTPPDGSYIFRN